MSSAGDKKKGKSITKSTKNLALPNKILPNAPEVEQLIIGTLIGKPYLMLKYPFLKKEIFYKESNKIIFERLQQLVFDDQNPDLVLLKDALEINDELEQIGGLNHLLNLAKIGAFNIDRHVKVITDRYFLRELIRIADESKEKSFEGTIDPVEIADDIENELIHLFEFESDVTNNFKGAIKSTIENMRLASEGTVSTTLKTGFKKIDQNLSLRSRFICIVAGPEASGKSKFVISLARGILRNESNVAIQWFSMEDDREELVRSFIAQDVRKTTKELQSINYEMSEDDFSQVEKALDEMSHYNIDIYDKAIHIDNLVNRARRFGNKYQDKKKLVIIDNLGLIQSEKFGIDRDDFLAAKIKWIADSTNSSVILVHHFTKEVARKANLDEGYRPRKEYLKGSTRILDYVQQALFINLPSKYPDLVIEEKQIPLNFLGNKDIEYNDENFDKYLWKVNSQRDKDTQALVDLKGETKIKLKSLLRNNIITTDKHKVTFPFIIQKYTEYSNSVDTQNYGREERYKKQKASIYTFIVRKMYQESYIADAESRRSKYLYGNDKKLRGLIDNLFIAESIKNRDDDNIEDKAIFRFIVDLGYNIFEEVAE